jgi:hypothetical protein
LTIRTVVSFPLTLATYVSPISMSAFLARVQKV